MLTGDVRPKTLEGVKRLAAQLRKEKGIKHTVALDLAARAADCTNFQNARRTLPMGGKAHSQPYVMLSVYWQEDTTPYRRGRETLKIELARPLLETCGKSELKSVRGFSHFRMVADDHLVCDRPMRTQDYSRELLCTAERSLRFMEHTGLRPFRDRRRVYPKNSLGEELPDSDHPTYWIEPGSGQFILIDEPYRGQPDEAKRAAWAARVGWRVVKTSWPGMYNPHNCDLYVVADGTPEYDLGALVAKINAMPAPLLEKDWFGDSSLTWETFVSPMAKTTQDVRRARCKGTIYRSASATTVPYNSLFGSLKRRPAGEMGLAGHINAGRLIKSVLSSDNLPAGVYSRMGALRSTLEDWMGLELRDGHLADAEFFDVYYGSFKTGGTFPQLAKSHAEIVALLSGLKQVLADAYPACAPLRREIHRIEKSISMIGKMK